MLLLLQSGGGGGSPPLGGFRSLPMFWLGGLCATAVVSDDLRGRSRRRRRFWVSELARADLPTSAIVAQERKIIEEMLVAAELDQLISEQKILRGALDQAAKRQAKTINGLIAQVERRIVEIQDEDDEIIALLGG